MDINYCDSEYSNLLWSSLCLCLSPDDESPAPVAVITVRKKIVDIWSHTPPQLPFILLSGSSIFYPLNYFSSLHHKHIFLTLLLTIHFKVQAFITIWCFISIYMYKILCSLGEQCLKTGNQHLQDIYGLAMPPPPPPPLPRRILVSDVVISMQSLTISLKIFIGLFNFWCFISIFYSHQYDNVTKCFKIYFWFCNACCRAESLLSDVVNIRRLRMHGQQWNWLPQCYSYYIFRDSFWDP